METTVETGAPVDTQATPMSSRATSATGQARPVAEQAREVKEQAKDLAEQVQEKATQKVESGMTKAKGQVAESLHALNQSLLISGQQLRDRNQQNVSRYVDNLANRVERAASYLQNTDITEIIDRTEDFARRKPAILLGGAFVLGLLGARFLKSSRRGVEREEWRGMGARGYRETTMRYREGPVSRFAPAGAQQEWSALRTPVTSADPDSRFAPAGQALADVPNTRVETQSLGESGLGRSRDTIDYDAIVASSPDASRR